MSQELNIGKLGAIAPFKAKEGTITITETAGAHGAIKAPVLSAALGKGDLVELDGEMTVKAHSSGVPIGFVYNVPKWEKGEPRQNYTQAQATSAGMLREVAVECIFSKIVTLDAKASEGIAAGDYVDLKAKVEKADNATNAMALSAQDTNNRVIVGLI